jgi:hypothetical protein
MGTRSTISIENEDGTCTGVYCHWDGYLSHHGPILLGAYDTAEKVRALIAPGDMSELDWSPGEKHDFNNRPEGQCNYYGRDCGETGTEPKAFPVRDAIETMGYDYLFGRDGVWYVKRRDVAFVPLREAVEADAAENAAE